tara:strand:+ start:1225 stop:1758 length:534 start_codon:yes stop_codon:yes gene_type:complete
MSIQLLQSYIPQQNQNIKCNDVEIRGALSVAESITAVGNLSTTGNSTAKVAYVDEIYQKLALSFTQSGTIESDVDAAGAGLSRLFQVNTVDLTMTAGANHTFNILLPAGALTAWSVVNLSIYNYSGSYATQGTPFAYVASIDPSVNRIVVLVKNIAVAEALNGNLTLNISINAGAGA